MSKMLALSLALLLVLGMSATHAAAVVPSTDSNELSVDVSALQTQALTSLQAAYSVLTTGVSVNLIPQTSEVGLARTAGERTGDLLRRRAFNARHGLTFTGATVTLNDVQLVAKGDQLALNTLEYVRLPFTSATRPPDRDRDVTEMWIPHTFVFTQVGGTWVLTFDDAGGFNDAGPAPDLPGPPPAQVRDTARVGLETRVAASGFAPRTLSISPPSSRVGPSAFGTYNRNAAGDYAYNWAYGRNPAYRDFSGSGGDCTNFVSQALRAGGWTDKLGWYLDWNNWWYNASNQTQSWTYVPAMKQFVWTSGRGVALSYLSDMQKGDMMQVDFGANGSWDHAAIVDSRYSSNLGDIYISYHTTDTRHRSISDFLAAVPIPGNNYMAWNIVATSN